MEKVLAKQVVQQLRKRKSKTTTKKKHERYPPRLILENFHRTLLSCKCDEPFSCCTTYFLYNYQPLLRNFESIVMQCPKTLKLAQNQNIQLVFIFGDWRATLSVQSNV